MSRRTKRAAARVPSAAEALGAAAKVANGLGHLALWQGRAFECARCGASGLVGPDGKQLGAVFKERCQ